MQNVAEFTSITYAIQQAVAPVFLLTGIGAILNVITTRIARIVDRARALRNSNDAKLHSQAAEMDMLRRRVRWVHWAVSLCTLSALLICIVIAALFVGSEVGVDPSRVVSLFFITAMLALISGLVCFLREIYLATGNIEMQKNI